MMTRSSTRRACLHVWLLTSSATLDRLTQDVYTGRPADSSPAVAALEHLIPLPEDNE